MQGEGRWNHIFDLMAEFVQIRCKTQNAMKSRNTIIPLSTPPNQIRPYCEAQRARVGTFYQRPNADPRENHQKVSSTIANPPSCPIPLFPKIQTVHPLIRNPQKGNAHALSDRGILNPNTPFPLLDSNLNSSLIHCIQPS